MIIFINLIDFLTLPCILLIYGTVIKKKTFLKRLEDYK